MKKLITLLCCFFALQITFAQKIVGYIDGRLADADANAKQLQWTKLTDIIYGFIQPSDNNGNLETLSGAPLTVFNTVKSLASQNGVKFHFSSGGANYTVKQQLAAISANATARTTYAKNVADILAAHNMDGFDLDWEFPTGVEVDNHVLLLKALREEFDKRGKGWTLAIAVGGETPSTGSQGVYHTDYVSANAFQYIDYLNLMAYDVGASLGGNNHSSLKNALDNINDYAKKGCPKSKMILGVPFYGRDLSRWNWLKYSDIAKADPATAYNSDNVGAQYYNGKKTLQDKVKLIMDQGGIGIMVWEVTYDRLGNDQYSLLGALYETMKPYQCNAPQPNLGAAVSICGSTSVTLNSGITTTTGLTFTWKDKNNAIIPNAKSKTYTATSAGKYTVEVSNGTCTNSSTVEVLGTLPSINLGPTIDLCKPATATLDAKITGNGITFAWQKDTKTIDNATSSTLVIDRAGTYKVTASATGCTASSASVVVTSQLINVEHQTLACKGNATMTVTDAGSYEWYDAATNGNKLFTGSSFTKNITQTTTFYVQKLANARVQATGCDGLDEWVAQVYSGGFSVSYKGKKYKQKWYAEPTNIPGQGDPWELLGDCQGISCDRTPVTITLQNGGICTGTSTNEATNTFVIAPNPVENQAIISFTLENDNYTTIQFINLQGQIVKEITAQLTSGNQAIEINTSELNKGIYICKILTDTKILTSKFSK